MPTTPGHEMILVFYAKDFVIVLLVHTCHLVKAYRLERWFTRTGRQEIRRKHPSKREWLYADALRDTVILLVLWHALALLGGE